MPEYKLKKLIEGKAVNISSVDKIMVSIKGEQRDYNDKKLDHLQKIRNKLVHSSIDADELREIIKIFPDLYKKTGDLAANLLKKKKILNDAGQELQSCRLIR